MYLRAHMNNVHRRRCVHKRIQMENKLGLKRNLPGLGLKMKEKKNGNTIIGLRDSEVDLLIK